MTQTLKDILLDPARRPVVVSDLQELVGQEVSSKGGVSGAVIKTGYAAVNKLKPGAVPNAVDRMLDQFADALQPFYADYRNTGGNDFGSYLAARPSDAANALLSVTDQRAETTSSDAMKKTYSKLRPHGQKNVEEALPRLGALIDKHAN
ncbi:DUF6918 family protein [Pseudonocardia sp. TRM90224]|uniref:DUF6918 family protein n=1 Tax=Pseudonocardia sp. TRM90224 TaxID=2812678 RepID=UPI001E634BD8|nr:hypothetical protein [Pseudonocardia sp. TRM90224]